MDAIKLKEYILENNLIKDILQYCDCHSINDSNNKFVRCSLKDKNNLSIGVSKETLYVKDFGNDSLCGDIYYFIMMIKNITFSETIKVLHSLFNLKYEPYIIKNNNEEYVDPLRLFKKIKSLNNSIEFEDLQRYDEDITSGYIDSLHIDWVKEGILQPTIEKFSLGFSPKHNRIIIPHRHYETGDIVGIIGRTTNELYKELDIPKYYPIIKYSKSHNVYGLYENYKDIQKNGYVVVYEAEKSVIKRSARFDNTGVSLGCHSISEQQVSILKSLNVEVVIALDKDVDTLKILEMCDKFYPLTNISFIKDKYDLTKDKESPADTNMENFNKLFNNRIKFDEKWHNLYIKLKNGGKIA